MLMDQRLGGVGRQFGHDLPLVRAGLPVERVLHPDDWDLLRPGQIDQLADVGDDLVTPRRAGDDRVLDVDD